MLVDLRRQHERGVQVEFEDLVRELGGCGGAVDGRRAPSVIHENIDSASVLRTAFEPRSGCFRITNVNALAGDLIRAVRLFGKPATAGEDARAGFGEGFADLATYAARAAGHDSGLIIEIVSGLAGAHVRVSGSTNLKVEVRGLAV